MRQLLHFLKNQHQIKNVIYTRADGSTFMEEGDEVNQSDALSQTTVFKFECVVRATQAELQDIQRQFRAHAQVSFVGNDNGETTVIVQPFSQTVNAFYNENASVLACMTEQEHTQYLNAASHLYLYPDQQREQLTECLAKRHGLLSDNVLVAEGSIECIKQFIAFERKSKEEVVIVHPTPTFDYRVVFSQNHISAEHVAIAMTAENKVDMPAIEAKLQELAGLQKNACVYLCNPNNPTGELLDASFILNLVKIFPKINFLVDEAYAEYTNHAQSVVSEIGEHKNLFVVKTMSKFFGLAGARVGYLLGNATTIREIQSDIAIVSPNMMGCRMSLMFLENTSLQEKVMQSYLVQRNIITSCFDTQKIEYMSCHANFVMCRPDNARKFKDYLADKGILISGIIELNGQQWLRVSFVDLLSSQYIADCISFFPH